MEWMLDPGVVHLNHGSFGACLRSVFDAATAWRTKLEGAPMRWLVLEWQAELDRARAALAAFVAAPAERLVFVSNATTGVAIALRSLALPAGSQVITTNHAYRAVKNQLERERLVVREVEVPLPFDADQLVERIAAAITPDTKLAVLDHITSPTALVFPIARIVPRFAARGIPVIVDGAHAPGQVPLDLASLLALGATYYTGNNHKWLCAPKASGFLVSAAHAPTIPVVTSHGASPAYGPANRMHAELDWTGTYDPAPQLVVPDAIRALDWPTVTDRNQRVAGEMADRLARRLGATRISRSHASMVALRITTPAPPFEIETQLLRDGWEVPIVDHAVGPLVRISAHLYNTADQADALAAKLLALGVRGR
jgi:isopenicillin-N epimerase